ncbi:hypothetical protein [Clostridium saudiense]|uniref:Uncharacterized protein n=2 Tax=Clostridium TaxID=1485 RepID=A0ABS2FJD2_9CLOT|nr:hypothetical protein [Clostridium saudiense]MBM6820685.1 hypothetical protein [Clostridium saudiense]MCI9069235.1 hypothetical protein [Clostridium sp.]
MLDQLLMLQNKLIQDSGFEEKLINEILEFIKSFKGTLLYPRVIKRKFRIDMKNTYIILNELVKNDLLTIAYEIYCSECDKFQNDIYDSLNEIPKNICCEYCGKDIDIMKDAIVVFKVKNNAG